MIVTASPADCTAEMRAEAAIDATLERIQRQLRAIAVADRIEAITSGDVENASRQLAELASGVTGCEISEWNALLAPAGTPPATIERLHADIAKILATEEIKAKFADLGAQPIGSTPAELAAFLRGEMVKWAEVVKVANVKIE